MTRDLDSSQLMSLEVMTTRRVSRALVGMMPFVVAGLTGLFAAFGTQTTPAQIHPVALIGLTIAALGVFAIAVRPSTRWILAYQSARRAGRDVGLGRKLFKRFPNLAELFAVLVGSHTSAALGISLGFLASGISWYALNLAAVLSLGGTSVLLQIPINIVSYTVLTVSFSYLCARGADQAT